MPATNSLSDQVRKHAVTVYLVPAKRRRAKTVAVNVGNVHRALKLINRVPLVCAALASKKFQRENHLRLVSKTGPESGQSTTVTFTYELLDSPGSKSRLDAWEKLRGALKDVYAEFGGGEAYLRAERASFDDTLDRE